jgi:type II secretory pathway component PulJ
MRRRGLFISIRQHGIPPGISLVEVVVAMATATLLMGLSMTTLQTVMRAERETSEATWLGASFQRFSRLIRTDIHAAETLKLEPETDAKTLVIQKPGQEQVTYRIEQFRIFRIVSRAGKTVHRDTFYFPEGSQAHFIRQQRLNQAGIVIREPDTPLPPEMRNNKTAGSQGPSSHEFSIRSTIGHDYRLAEIRFEQPEKETKPTN